MLKRLTIVLMFCLLAIPAYSTELTAEQTKNRGLVRHYAKVFKVDVDFCESIGKIESDFKTGAYNDNTPGTTPRETWISRGPMQLTIYTGRAFNKKIRTIQDLYNAEQNIIAGVKFIRYLFTKYPELSYVEVAQIYNLGETRYFKGSRNQDYVDKFLRAFNSIKKK